MGFWGNLADEAGKKTGKAITNTLFGNAAADQTIDIKGGLNNPNSSSGGGSDDITTQLKLQKQNIELEAEIREKEKNQKILDDILLLEFEAENIATNIKILTKLSSMIDIWIKDENMAPFYDVAITKFDTGLLISQAIDSNNPFVAIMTKKKEEWNAYITEQAELEQQRLIQIEQEAQQRQELKKKEAEKNALRTKKFLIFLGIGIGILILISLLTLLPLLLLL